ncbi:hypothetical protein G7Z17_g1830 [Cylindrodendrum hubeiense]|uniref:Uncharacterized protein n=1 Tax=Cylindrodendrum hubeiense TaxID=595255 RepID=A0A9P5HK36_9HYPO|nr:hypothetical protein G7Z17_g1830 [Cylindrodendrum hubeiense]
MLQAQLTAYSGASFGKKRNGPIMLPMVYAMNIIAEATLFLVKPATLEEIIERQMGNPAAKATNNQSPTN